MGVNMIQKIFTTLLSLTLLSSCNSFDKYHPGPEKKIIVGNIKIIDVRDIKKPKDVTEHCKVYFNSKMSAYSLDKSGRVISSVKNNLVKINRLTCYPSKLLIGAIERDFKYRILSFKQTNNKNGTTYFGDLIIAIGKTSVDFNWAILTLDFTVGVLSGGLVRSATDADGMSIHSSWDYRTQNNLVNTQTWLEKIDPKRTQIETSIISTRL